MNLTRRLAMAALLAVVFAAGAFATGTTEEADAGPADQVLSVGLRKLTTIDPALGANDPEVLFNRLQYDYLIEILPDGTLAPSLATSWETSSDGLTFSLELRDGVTFEDGTSFDSADVVFTFERLVTAGSSIVGLLGTDDDGPTWTVSADGPLGVEFQLEQPNADFIYGVASRFAMILPSGAADVNVIASGSDPYANFNGTGPFVLSEYAADQRAVLVANENYWGGAPDLDSVELVFFDDDQSQLDAFRSGDLDFIIKVPDDLLAALDRVPDTTVVNQATNTHPVIRLRADEGSIGEDARLRQAFKYATDRELINLDVLNGAGTVGNNDPIGPTYGVLYNPQSNQPFDPERAKELIAEVLADGTGNGYVVEVDGEARVEVPFYVGNTFEYGLVAEFLQQQWEESNIFVDLNVVPENVYYAEGDNNWINTQLGMTAWGARPTPQEYLSVAYTTGAPFNEAAWSNAELDALANQASQTADTTARGAIYDQISEIFLEEGPILIPYFRPVVGAYKNYVQGLDMHSFPGRTNLAGVSIQ